jgi:hypothetical protein
MVNNELLETFLLTAGWTEFMKYKTKRFPGNLRVPFHGWNLMIIRTKIFASMEFWNDRMFDGLVVMNDSNLQFDFLGKVNFNPEVPVFDFRLDLQKALLGNLNLSDEFPKAELAFLMNANFSGNRIDNLAGLIKVENGTYKNRNGELNLGGMELQSIASGLNNYLTFSSDFFDLEINGSFYAQSIQDAFEKGMYKYLPTVGYDPLEQAKANKFGYQIDVKNLNDLTAVFLPKIKIETPFLLYGQMDSENSVFELKGSIPGIHTEECDDSEYFYWQQSQR